MAWTECAWTAGLCVQKYTYFDLRITTCMMVDLKKIADTEKDAVQPQNLKTGYIDPFLPFLKM